MAPCLSVMGVDPETPCIAPMHATTNENADCGHIRIHAATGVRRKGCTSREFVYRHRLLLGNTELLEEQRTNLRGIGLTAGGLHNRTDNSACGGELP